MIAPSLHLGHAVLLHETVWAIEVNAGRSLWQAIQSENWARHAAEFEARERRTEERDTRPYTVEDGVALFSIAGPMTKASTSWSAGTSTVRLRRDVRLARRDPDVKSGLLMMDSPGGSVSGTADLAAEIAAFAAEKPMIGYAEDTCCSACMWAASQCTAVYANPTAMVGSIGTLMVLHDMSRYAANAGIEVLVFGSGAYKGSGTDGAPVTPEQRAYFQQMVTDLNAHFLAAVKSGRNLSDEQLESVSDARVHIGQAAVDMGLIDGIRTLDDTLALASASGRDTPRADTGGKEIRSWGW